MSHTMNIKTEMRDKEALLAACERLGTRMEEGTFSLYASREKGLGVFLSDWSLPVVVKEDGTISYDNYDGEWGNITELDRLKDAYGLEKAAMEARKQGYSVFETTDEQGHLQLRIRVGE